MNVEELQVAVRTANLTVSQIVVWASPEARETLCSNTVTRTASPVVVSEIELIIKHLSNKAVFIPGTSRVTSSKIKVSKINPPNPNLPNHDDTLPDVRDLAEGNC